MAEILIMNRDNTHQDPTKNETSCWKKGDIVFIADDNHPWGKEELNEEIFKIIKIPGSITAMIRMFRQPWITQKDTADEMLLRRSLWRYDFDNDRFVNKENMQIVQRGLLNG